MMRQAPLAPRLNCPWRASAAPAMVRSALSVHSAAILAVRLALPVRAPSASGMASMPIWTPATEQAEDLFVALRIDKLISEAI